MRNPSWKLSIRVVESMIRTWTVWSPGGTVKRDIIGEVQITIDKPKDTEIRKGEGSAFLLNAILGTITTTGLPPSPPHNPRLYYTELGTCKSLECG